MLRVRVRVRVRIHAILNDINGLFRVMKAWLWMLSSISDFFRKVLNLTNGPNDEETPLCVIIFKDDT